MLAEFTQFGTNIVAITPGKSETFGAPGAAVSNVRPLSLEDAERWLGPSLAYEPGG